jgi:tRNA U34 5-methylaminomethyl-2-thiouridine-forming methyltransferase MnmC
MKDKRHYLSACSINDEFIYAFGGFFGSTEQEINDSIEVYEVEKNLWQVLTIRMKVNKYKFLNSSNRILYGLVVLYLFHQQKLF